MNKLLRKYGKKPLFYQFFRKMKLTILILTVSILSCFSAETYSQTTRLTITETNSTLLNVLKAIEGQSEFKFFYNEKVDVNRPVSVDVNQKSVTEILDKALTNTTVKYKVLGRQIALYDKNEMEPFISEQQSKKVTGKVTDSNGGSLPGVSVVVKGTTTGVITDNSGNYAVSNITGNAVLVFSFVGMKTQEVKTGSQSTINVVLAEEAIGLEEVVAIGYGTEKKKDITGSVSSVNLGVQEKTPVLSTAQLLEGRVAGVEVTQQQSQPGSTFSIRIRGTSSISSSSEPLFVVDGFAGAYYDINPSDVLTIDILKDASATAIYGSRGANGVIIITTKKGSTTAPKITVDAYTGIQQTNKQYNMMDAKQYAVYNNTVIQQNNSLFGFNYALPYTQAQIDALGKGTNWQDAILRIAPISNVSISLNKSDNDSKHYLSLQLSDQKGVVIGSDYQKAIIRYNLDETISPKFRTGINSQINYSFQHAVPVNQDNGISLVNNAMLFNPAVPVFDSNGDYSVSNQPASIVGPLGNPVAYAKKVTNHGYNVNLFVNTYAEYELLTGLKLKSTFGVNYATGGTELFIPTTIYDYLNVGYAGQTSRRSYNWLNENTITYNKNIAGIHAINVIGGFTFQHWYDKGFGTSIAYLTTNLLGTDNLSVGTPNVPSSYSLENVLASYFGRINYQLKEKYLLTFTIRADGSSRFGANSKWGYFPSGAFAWHASQENFIKNIAAISDLKLRLSYGVTGNQEIGSYNSLSQYNYNQYSLGSKPILAIGIQPGNIANPNLKWETTATSNIGLDLGLWNNRLMISADYYEKKTSDLLLNVSIPQTSGYTSILQNIGLVDNKGFEFSVTSKNIENKKISWSTSFTFSTNKNKVISLGPNPYILTGGLSSNIFHGNSFNTSILQPGYPIGEFYGYLFDGIWQNQDQITQSKTKQPVHPGDPIYKDLNNDGLLNGSDRTFLGQATPKFTYGMTNNITMGRFNLNILLHGVYGNMLINENLYNIQNGNINYNKLAYVATDSWTGPGTSNTLPRVSSVYRVAMGCTSDVLESGSFLRLKTVSLSYNVPLQKFTKVFKSANVYVTGQNLFTITKYTGYDPEVSSSTDPHNLGLDNNAYPNYKTILVGVKLGF